MTLKKKKPSRSLLSSSERDFLPENKAASQAQPQTCWTSYRRGLQQRKVEQNEITVAEIIISSNFNLDFNVILT